MGNDLLSIMQENLDTTKRMELIRSIENALENRYGKKISVISYIFNTVNPTVFLMNISHIPYLEDLVRLAKSDNAQILGFIVDSYGGDANFPMELVNKIRAYYSEFFVIGINVLKSAATLLSIISDKIVAIETTSFGPIDPQLIVENRPISARSVIDLYDRTLPEYLEKKSLAEKVVIQSAQDFTLYQQARDAMNFIDQTLSSLSLPEERLLRVKSKLIDTPPSHGLRVDLDELATLGFSVDKIKVSEPIADLLIEYHRRVLKNLNSFNQQTGPGTITQGLVLFESTKRSMQLNGNVVIATPPTRSQGPNIPPGKP